MQIEIPAAGLVATGACSAACLLALDDDCECTHIPTYRKPAVEAPMTGATGRR
jgi:hypothetical protein